MPFANVKQAISAKKIGSLLGPGSSSIGEIKTSSGIKMDGRHVGSILIDGADDAVLWITAAAVIKGDVYAPEVYIDGFVHGSIYANRVYLLKRSSCDGDVHSLEISHEAGAKLNGEVHRLLAPGDYKEKYLSGRAKVAISHTAKHLETTQASGLSKDSALKARVR